MTDGANVKIGSVVQTSGVTANNFTSPIVYTVTSGDNNTSNYTVTVTKAASIAKAITPYSFAGQPDSVGMINETFKTIAVSVLPGIDLTRRTATFTTTGTSVKVNGVTQVSGTTLNNFTSPVAYIIADASSGTQQYDVTVTHGFGPIPVDLGTAENFTILTKAGITNIPTSTITGNVGIPNVLNKVLGSTPLSPTYKWGGNVAIATDLTLNGGVNDVWIFQIAGTLDIPSGKKIILTGGAQAKNIFWQVAGVVTLGTTSQFKGIILSASKIAMLTGASINGRLLAETEVTLQSNAVTQP